jgi:hypothetical protein
MTFVDPDSMTYVDPYLESGSRGKKIKKKRDTFRLPVYLIYLFISRLKSCCGSGSALDPDSMTVVPDPYPD